jgi:hypothetical protein
MAEHGMALTRDNDEISYILFALFVQLGRFERDHKIVSIGFLCSPSSSKQDPYDIYIAGASHNPDIQNLQRRWQRELTLVLRGTVATGQIGRVKDEAGEVIQSKPFSNMLRYLAPLPPPREVFHPSPPLNLHQVTRTWASSI